jgi:uncharacterized protein involved in exopolysaccharide biosynthesis/Mrp family chromosome partitioning ATPase
MNNNRQAEPAASITLGDVYFVIFRHKWKIIILSAAGIVAAVVFYLLNPPLYQSESELFIRYITDSRSPTPDGNNNDTTTTSPGLQGGSVINSEIRILTSFDLAQEVAAAVGPDKILAKAGGGADPTMAAIMVKNGLVVEPAPNSSVIDIVFKHPDPSVVQPVLREIVNDYQNKHLEIHQVLGTEGDFLNDQTTQLRAEIAQTESELMSAKTNVGVISLDDAKKTVEEQIAKIQGQLLDVEVQLATRQGVLDITNQPSSGDSQATNALAAAQIPSDQIDAYSKAALRLVILEKKKDEFVEQGYTEENVLVKDLAGQIDALNTIKTNLEAKYPGLATLAISAPDADGQGGDSSADSAKLSELKSEVAALNKQLDGLRQEAITIGEAEPKINDLTRKQQIEEQNLQYFLKSLDDARINEALGAGKISGIKSIQEPTPPSLAESKRLKISGMLAGGGIALALALAFLIDFYLDRSVKRPTEIENKLRMPLFLSIPDVRRNGTGRRAARQLREKNDEAFVAGGGAVGKTGNLQVAPWSPNHSLRAFYEALRDRIVVHFEVRNITRNPKLVAVTSANRGAGVTSIAMGLAASLSETGEGNVLLVDMNAEQGAVQQFYKGKPGCPLDDAFVSEKRNGALVQDNLYVVSDSSGADKLPRIMPKRFSSLLPKFKASDYDYIIFDMPPVSQTSVTPRLAGHMDMVLLVVEAEKTKQEVVRRANSLLAESKANVIAVLNKSHQYVPEQLHQEFLSDG